MSYPGSSTHQRPWSERRSTRICLSVFVFEIFLTSLCRGVSAAHAEPVGRTRLNAHGSIVKRSQRTQSEFPKNDRKYTFLGLDSEDGWERHAPKFFRGESVKSEHRESQDVDGIKLQLTSDRSSNLMSSKEGLLKARSPEHNNERNLGLSELHGHNLGTGEHVARQAFKFGESSNDDSEEIETSPPEDDTPTDDYSEKETTQTNGDDMYEPEYEDEAEGGTYGDDLYAAESETSSGSSYGDDKFGGDYGNLSSVVSNTTAIGGLLGGEDKDGVIVPKPATEASAHASQNNTSEHGSAAVEAHPMNTLPSSSHETTKRPVPTSEAFPESSASEEPTTVTTPSTLPPQSTIAPVPLEPLKTQPPMEQAHVSSPEPKETASSAPFENELGSSESVSFEENIADEDIEELEKEEEEEEKEKEEILEEELAQEEREVRRIGGFGGFLAIVAMIFTAHQMSENPDGIYASCCRLIITLCDFAFKIVLMPFRSAAGGSRGYGHLPVNTMDYGYKDPYRPGASGGSMELS